MDARGTVTPSGSRDFADWIGGPVEAPRGLEVYNVRFYCAASGENARESVPSHLCYGVRYACDRTGQRGYIQIPGMRDREFPRHAQAIYRGVEGTWYRASDAWDAVVRSRLLSAREAELEAGLRTQRQNDYLRQPTIETRSSTRAVGATPKVTPKPR